MLEILLYLNTILILRVRFDSSTACQWSVLCCVHEDDQGCTFSPYHKFDRQKYTPTPTHTFIGINSIDIMTVILILIAWCNSKRDQLHYNRIKKQSVPLLFISPHI